MLKPPQTPNHNMLCPKSELCCPKPQHVVVVNMWCSARPDPTTSSGFHLTRQLGTLLRSAPLPPEARPTAHSRGSLRCLCHASRAAHATHCRCAAAWVTNGNRLFQPHSKTHPSIHHTSFDVLKPLVRFHAAGCWNHPNAYAVDHPIETAQQPPTHHRSCDGWMDRGKLRMNQKGEQNR
jgi:hypothetical protein